MAQNTLYWHDYETFGLDTARDRPVQFAGIRTDEDLNIIGEPLMIYARPADDFLPQPMSCLITGITPQMALEKGLPEAEFIAQIHAELSQPGTCGVGYNSLRFDDEVTRNTLYRNLYDPYAREWQNGNSRWDIIDLVRAAHDLRPEGIVWPRNEELDRTSFRLELLTEANGIGHEAAHDALSDVYATIALARLIKEKQPRLFDFAYKLRRKQEAAKLIDLRGMTPLLHTSGMYGSDHGNTRVVVPLAPHPVNKNSTIVFDLSQDPSLILDLGWKKIRERLYTPNAEMPEGVERPALKQVHINKSPVLAPTSTLDGAAAKRLDIDLARCLQNRQTLLAHRKTLQEKMAKVFAPQEYEPRHDPDLMLYGGGFFSDADKKRMMEIHKQSPEELADREWLFDDKRLPEMLLRFRARNWPETLNDAEREEWQAFRRARLIDGESDTFNMERLQAELARVREEEALSDDKNRILTELESYAEGLVGGLN